MYFVISSSLPWSFWLILSHSNVFFTWWRLWPEEDLKILQSLFSRFDLTSWFYSRSESSFLNAVVSFWMKSLWLHSYSLITYCSLILLINSPSRKRWFLKIAFQMFYNTFYNSLDKVKKGNNQRDLGNQTSLRWLNYSKMILEWIKANSE